MAGTGAARAPADVGFLRRELAAGALAPNGREEGRRGETCLCKFAKKGTCYDEQGKLAARWCRGVFLGYDRLTNEYILHTQGRILKSRAIQRLVADRRWSADAIEEIRTRPQDAYRKPAPARRVADVVLDITP